MRICFTWYRHEDVVTGVHPGTLPRIQLEEKEEPFIHSFIYVIACQLFYIQATYGKAFFIKCDSFNSMQKEGTNWNTTLMRIIMVTRTHRMQWFKQGSTFCPFSNICPSLVTDTVSEYFEGWEFIINVHNKTENSKPESKSAKNKVIKNLYGACLGRKAFKTFYYLCTDSPHTDYILYLLISCTGQVCSTSYGGELPE